MAKRSAHVRLLALLADFEEKFEELTDLLCSTAKEGNCARRGARYAALRAWMVARYADLYLSLRPHWHREGERDPFQALFASPSLEQVLYASHSIEDLLRGRAALDACRVLLQEKAGKEQGKGRARDELSL